MATTSGHRPTSRTAGAVLAAALAMLASALAFGSPAGAQQPPVTLTLSHSEDLVAGQTIEATITGGAQVADLAGITTCRAGATSLAHCDLGAVVIVSSPLSDPAVVTYTAVRHIVAAPLAGGPPELVDCAVSDCEIVLGNISGTMYASTPVTFVDTPLPPASMTLEPLSAHGTSALAAEGLPPARNVQIAAETCDAPGACEYLTMTTARVDDDGTLEASVSMPFDPDFHVSCALGDCRIVIRIVPLLQNPYLLVGVEPDVVFEEVGVTVDPFVVYDSAPDALDEIVGSATITCDSNTFISAEATITQGTNEWSYLLEDGFCNGSPYTAWIPSRTQVSTGDPIDPDAPVTITVHVSPLRTPVATVGTTASATVGLTDQATVLDAIAAALEGPDGAEIAQQIIDAIARRVAQDPVFAADFAAAIFG